MKLISEGAEAKIFETELLGIDAVLKRRARKDYRIEQLDCSIRDSRTKSEAKMLSLATTNGVSAPRVLLVDRCDLYLTKINGKRLVKLTVKQAKEAGSLLGKLHSLDIAHGDFTPANMMLGSDGRLYIIDFGLAEITRSVEEKALDLLLVKRSVSRDIFSALIEDYRKRFAGADAEIARLAEIEKRGRYQTRPLETEAEILN